MPSGRAEQKIEHYDICVSMYSHAVGAGPDSSGGQFL